MDNTLANILGQVGLPQELVTTLQEAFDQKVAEARDEAEMSVRDEFARRYEHDKAELVEAMDRMLNDVVQKHEENKIAEAAKLTEARTKYNTAVKESRKAYKTKMAEHMTLTRKFVMEQLTKEITGLRAEKNELIAERIRVAEEVEATKQALAETQAQRLKKIDEFVVRRVGKELNEFAQDKRALVETRVKLVAESRGKLKDTQSRFVKESAKKVEKMVSESLNREMTQLHEELERNRQNMFGRRIFEAVAAEFMSSYLAEGTEIRTLQNVLEAKETELNTAKAKLEETAKAAELAARKVKLAEDRAIRTKIMSELLSNLRGEKRNVMEGMLETVKTQALRESFNKLLPVVLNENARKVAPQAKKTLNEGASQPQAKRTVAVTGDQRNNRLFETAQPENEIDSEIAQIVRLSGIQK